MAKVVFLILIELFVKFRCNDNLITLPGDGFPKDSFTVAEAIYIRSIEKIYSQIYRCV